MITGRFIVVKGIDLTPVDEPFKRARKPRSSFRFDISVTLLKNEVKHE